MRIPPGSSRLKSIGSRVSRVVALAWDNEKSKGDPPEQVEGAGLGGQIGGVGDDPCVGRPFTMPPPA
jgi:hypothetical protein